MDLRQLPAQEFRVETGPVRFGDDWPGVFIRGDNAHWMGMTLKWFLEHHPPGSVEFDCPIQRSVVEGLANTLLSCHIDNFRSENG